MQKKIIIPRKKLQLVMDSFITIWEKNLPSEDDLELGKSFRIGEIPEKQKMKDIFYSILGFNNHDELLRFTKNNEKKIWVNRSLGDSEFFPNEELFLSAVRKALAPIIFTSALEEKASDNPIKKRATIIKDFFNEALQFIDVFEYDQQDWEVYTLDEDSVKHVVENPENRVSISLSEPGEGLLDIYDPESMGYQVEIINIQNMFKKYQDIKLDTDLSGNLYRVRLMKATDINLLNTFILKSTLMNAKWVIEVREKLANHKNLKEKLRQLSNVSDITIKVQ